MSRKRVSNERDLASIPILCKHDAKELSLFYNDTFELQLILKKNIIFL